MCNYTKGAEAGKSCHFPIPSLNECTEAKSYGYAAGKPCIFLKMNKVRVTRAIVAIVTIIGIRTRRQTAE